MSAKGGRKINVKTQGLAAFRQAVARIRDEKVFFPPAVGAVMADGSVFAGVTPGTTPTLVFAAPADADVYVSFNTAAAAIEKLNSENYLGHDDWRLPDRAELEMLHAARTKGALRGTFQEAADEGKQKFGTATGYWSQSARPENNQRYIVHFGGEQNNWYSVILNQYSCRPVRAAPAV